MAGKDVSYIKPQTPLFIEKFKQKVGYQDGPSVDTKFQEAEPSSADEPERDDEKPAVVLGSNVSESEAEAFLVDRLEKENEEENARIEGDSTDGGKIVFKKPKRKSSEIGKDLGKGKKKSKTASSMKKVKNKNLLSFDEEEDETG